MNQTPTNQRRDLMDWRLEEGIVRNDAEIEGHAESWVTGPTVDWDDWLDRVENDLQLDLGSDLTSPEIRRILAIGRRVRRESRT